MAELSVAGIICISVACYTLLILIIVVVRYFLVRRGMCQCDGCGVCGKEEAPQCSSCCVSMTDVCSCGAPSINNCLNSCCPNKKNVSCVDLLLCQCCLGEDNCFTNDGPFQCMSTMECCGLEVNVSTRGSGQDTRRSVV